MEKGVYSSQNLSKNNSQKGREPETNDLLKKLYSYTKNRSKAFKHIVKIHKNVFTALHKGDLHIESAKINIDKEISSYKPENVLKMDEEIMLECISIFDLFTGREEELQKLDVNQRRLIKKQEKINERINSKEKEENLLNMKQKEKEKEIEYLEKVKQYQKQKEFYDRKKKEEAQKREELLKKEEEKIMKEKELEIERQKEEKKKKLEVGLKEMEEKRKQRLETIKELALEHKRSKSMKAFGQNSVPKYIELEKEYLERERRKAEEFKEQQKQKRESMQLKIDEIKNHEKEYLEKIKAKFTPSNNKNRTQKQSSNVDSESIKVRSEFNAMNLSKDEEEEKKYREKAMRRKEFESKIRSIPINIDINKRKEKEIEIDKAVNKQKYMLLGKRRLDDEIIYNEFKNFEVNVDPRSIGNNYLNEIKLAPKPQKSERISKERSESSLDKRAEKIQYVNYLEELRLNNKIQRKSEPKLSETGELLKLAEKSKTLLKKTQEENQQIFESPLKFTARKYRQEFFSEPPSKSLSSAEVKNEASKSITEKIVEYERKVFKKVNDLKRISQYDEKLKNEHEIDNLYSKVLQAKLNSIDSI